MRKVILITLISLIIASISCYRNSSPQTRDTSPVNLVFTSWRTEDIDRMNRVNAVFSRHYPDINISFQPIVDSEYNDLLMADLNSGLGADIIYLRSYDTGRNVYNNGFLQNLNTEIVELKEYPATAVKAWTADNGDIYAIPSVGVTHGIYYQKEIFNRYELKAPATWDDFIDICETLLANGEIPIAQGGADDWTLYECVFSGLGPNFFGGEATRQQLMAGRIKMTDPLFLNSFKMVKSLTKYFPPNYETLDYVSMQQLFGTGEAAMFIGGSWEIGVFEDMGSDASKIDWFPPPVLTKGAPLQYAFHVDAGIGMNASTQHKQEALTYLKWTASTEYAQLFMNELPGFFSYTPGEYSLSNPLAKAMIEATNGAELTVRVLWEKLSSGIPSGNKLMGEALPNMINGHFSPEEAAEYVQDGLETWYTPFMN